MPPGFDVNMHIAVRNAKSGGLLATIIGIPMKVRTFDKVANFYEINFLCVHKKLRYILKLFDFLSEVFGSLRFTYSLAPNALFPF